MKLSEELVWRGFKYQTTLDDIGLIDQQKFKFYWGVDPSADSMTVGNLATAMMIRLFIRNGHKAYLLVGGATGLIGDPDGKSAERELASFDQIQHNKQAIARQYKRLFSDEPFDLVDNYDWFSELKYLDFLRDVGKHVPMRQMLGREFIQTRLGENGSGISYAEFSYVLIQAYDFYYLNQNHQVNLQLCGSDQWGNCVAGVDLIRRLNGNQAHVWAAPLIVNPISGAKFGKTEDGAIWLDPGKTSPTAFYQFWVNSDDAAVEGYLKIYTELTKEEIEDLLSRHRKDPKKRLAQFALADQVTAIVHGEEAALKARLVTQIITGQSNLSDADATSINLLKQQLPAIKAKHSESIEQVLLSCGLVNSKNIARQLLGEGAIYVNNERFNKSELSDSDFINGRLLLRRGKAYKDSALVELE